MPSRGRKRRNYGSTATHQLGTSGSGAFEFQGSVVKHGAQEHKYESLNYDRCENAIYRKALRDRFTQTQSIKAYSYTRWVITFFIGVLTGLVAFLIDVMTEHVFKLKFEIVGQSIERCEKEGCLVVTLLIFVGINAALVFVAAMCVVVEPVSAGSGIPEVKTYLNGIKVAHIVRLKTLICKALGVACSVSGGLPCGKEGPMIHCGSVIAAGISQGKSTSLPVVDLHFNMFRTDRAKRDFVSSGAAAGVAAAFGAPIGGVMFALEEGSSFWNQQLTWRSFFAAMMATFTLNLLLSGVRSHWGDLSFPGLVSFGSFSGTCQPTDPNCDVLTWQVVDLLIFLVLGACGGLLGALFNFINEHLTIYRMKHLFKRSKYARVVEALLVCSVTTLTMFCAALYLGSCKPVTSDEPTEFAARNRGYFCKEGEWNDMATLTYNSAESVIKMLFHKADDFSLPTLAYFFVFYFALACWTYGLGVPSGVFVPTLLTGACFGRLSAVLVQRAVDHLGIDYQIHYATYALIGAAAFLGGVVRMTISLTVILIETTNNVVFGLPLMMTLMVAKWVGDMFNEGIYMLHIELRQIPFLHWEPPAEMKGFYAAQVMAKDVVCVEEIERVADIEHLLRTHHHSAFPVVDRTNPAKGEGGHGLLLGIILRSQLVILLKHRAWGRRDGEAVDAPVLDYKDFISEYPRYPTIEHIHVPVEAHNQYIDLTPYMNPCPYVVQQISPLPRVFNLFRTMGLRHLPVVDRYNNLMGLITRKDLTNLEYRYSSDPDLETRGHGERLSLGRATSLLSNDLSMRSKDFFIAEGDVSSLRSFRGDPRIGFSRSSSMLEGEEIHGHPIAHSNTPSALSGLAINTNNNNNNINGLQNLI